MRWRPRALDVLKEQEECQELALGRTRSASKGGASLSQQEDAKNKGQVAPETKGVKRKRSAATTNQQQRKKQATEALAWDSPVRPASRPLLTRDGESPPDAYEPADPMDVG